MVLEDYNYDCYFVHKNNAVTSELKSLIDNFGAYFSKFKNGYIIKNDKLEFLKRVQSITDNYELKPKSN